MLVLVILRYQVYFKQFVFVRKYVNSSKRSINVAGSSHQHKTSKPVRLEWVEYTANIEIRFQLNYRELKKIWPTIYTNKIQFMYSFVVRSDPYTYYISRIHSSISKELFIIFKTIKEKCIRTSFFQCFLLAAFCSRLLMLAQHLLVTTIATVLFFLVSFKILLRKFILSVSFGYPTILTWSSIFTFLGLCQNNCLSGVQFCYASAGAVVGTLTAGHGTPAAVLACNSVYETCKIACGLSLIPLTP